MYHSLLKGRQLYLQKTTLKRQLEENTTKHCTENVLTHPVLHSKNILLTLVYLVLSFELKLVTD